MKNLWINFKLVWYSYFLPLNFAIDQLMNLIADIYLWIEYQITSFPAKCKWCYNSLYIHEDEFHKSLDLDAMLMLKLNEDDRKRYLKDITRRRDIAHHRDLEKKDAR